MAGVDVVGMEASLSWFLLNPLQSEAATPAADARCSLVTTEITGLFALGPFCAYESANSFPC